MPDLWQHVATAVAAGLGAMCRFLLDGMISSAVGSATARGGGRGVTRAGSLPWGTLAVNLSGSILIGIVAGALAGGDSVGGQLHSNGVMLAVALGLLGGYTTFSTASFQTVRLLRDRRWGLALATSLGQLAFAVAGAGLGWWVAAALVG